MSEPQAQATSIEFVFPDVLHWTIRDERIGHHPSEAYGIKTSGGVVCIDPVSLRPETTIGKVTAVVLTHRNHQRSAWSFRKRHACPVYVPEGASGLDESPDETYGENTVLPGNLQALASRGFQHSAYLLYQSETGKTVAFVSDLIFQDPKTGYRFPVQPGYFDPSGGIEDARRLIEAGVDCLAPGHGSPILEKADQVLEQAIRRIQ
ncbi:MAG: hypothetical protein ACE5D1_02360 [Fidelibacterota bacterium]